MEKEEEELFAYLEFLLAGGYVHIGPPDNQLLPQGLLTGYQILSRLQGNKGSKWKYGQLG